MYILDFPDAVPFSLFSRKILIVFLCILSWHRKTHSSCLNRKCERPDLEFYFQFPGTVFRFYFQSCNRREGWCAWLPVEFPFSGSSSSSGSALLWLSVFFFSLNIVSRFPGVDPNFGANVLCWESLLSASIASGLCFLCPYLQSFPRGSLHSREWLLPSPTLPVPPLISSSSLQSHSLKSFLKWRYIWLGHLND